MNPKNILATLLIAPALSVALSTAQAQSSENGLHTDTVTAGPLVRGHIRPDRNPIPAPPIDAMLPNQRLAELRLNKRRFTLTRYDDL